ncbi:MAG: hypothetical protein AB7S26_04245 [Sandaracinaceae bacterium]
MPFRRALPSLAFVLLFALGCDDGEPTRDAGTEDVRGCGVGLSYPRLRWSTPVLGIPLGESVDVYLEFVRDCNSGTTLTLSASDTYIVSFPNDVRIEPNSDRVHLRLQGDMLGTVTITASSSHPSGDTVSADIVVSVSDGSIPACVGSASGSVSPGASLDNGPNGSAIAIPEGAARDDQYHIDPFTASIDCGGDIVPDGFVALGPAVKFGPETQRLAREVPLTIPITLAALPLGANRGHVEMAYLPPHGHASRIVPIASPRFAGDAVEGTMTFEVPRLGTYQAVMREGVPTRRTRTYKFRGILGFSMGGSGTGRIGMGNPDLFDFVAPLGGPTDWTFMLEHIRRYHVGGFCTEAERMAGATDCDMATLARTPPTTQEHEHPQTFEHWWYEDGHDGQGGTFNRTDYISIFRDLATMFGNPNYDRTADPDEPSITPPGVPDTVRMIPDGMRCDAAHQTVIPPFDSASPDGTGFFDDEFNPEGLYPVITFCDGQEVDGDVGLWDPNGTPRMPIDVVVAVDRNGNGLRDGGEPVIRNGREPFDDFGLDGVRNEDETSPDGATYDPVTNPDPAGDDFDFQYNPTGTENNWERDVVGDDQCTAGAPGVAEVFLDFGLDGVMDTAQLAAANGLPGGGFDIGEGNGCFDRARGAVRMIETSPRYQAEHMDMDTLRDIDLFADGGIRDLFNWVVMGNVTTAGWSARGLPVRFYNGHGALHLQGPRELDYTDVNWSEVGRAAMVRYGSPDEEDRFIRAGDGGHVGTVQQLIDRIRSSIAMMDQRWPDGDRRRTDDRVCNELDTCGYVNSFVFNFTASTGREGPVTIVLPPGYFDPANADVRYPVVYFLHGYGMSPEDLQAFGLLMFADMNSPQIGSSRRQQKMILVFPDGRCRNDECLRGTFYTDAPDNVPGGARMQTFLLDLMQYMDTMYRTRAPEEFEVVE